jgi:hypothetical protein
MGTGAAGRRELVDAGANHVASPSIESRNCLGGFLKAPRLPRPGHRGHPPAVGISLDWSSVSLT